LTRFASPSEQNGVNVQDTLPDQVKIAIVRCLRMPIKPEEIDDDMPLFGEGLGLDSIDALEIVLELQRSFSVEISDEQVGKSALKSVSTIAQFIELARQTA
jgi:acyl carrier protein